MPPTGEKVNRSFVNNLGIHTPSGHGIITGENPSDITMAEELKKTEKPKKLRIRIGQGSYKQWRHSGCP